jgi:enoyl-CoA hydratase/carnithine racemase
MTERVTTRIADHIAHVRLNRADKMNALDPAMFDGIVGAIAALEQTEGLRAVVLAGEGRSFCAGLDMASMAGGGSGLDIAQRNDHGAVVVQQVSWGWRKLKLPVIAAAHGVCFGGGFQIFSGADIRVAHPETRFAIMEAKWGLVPDMAGWPLWRTLVRDDIVRELAFTGREFSGVEAKEYGFVTHLDTDPVAKATAIATEIATRSPQAVRGMKRLANMIADADDAALLLAETDEQLKVMRSTDQVEAVMANMQKREPVFQG